MKKTISSIKDALVPSASKITDSLADVAHSTANAIVEPAKSGLITKDELISQNINAKGFAFEHLHEISFNAKAELTGEPYLAIRIPPGGIKEINEKYGLDLPTERNGEPDIIINQETGELLATVQAKCGTEQTINNAIADEKYKDTDIILINSENSSLAEQHDNVQTALSYGDVTGMNISEDMANKVAENPELTEVILDSSGTLIEFSGGVIAGGIIGGIFSSLQSSLKVLGRVHRNEKVDTNILKKELIDVLEALKEGAVRGGVVKVLQMLLDGTTHANIPIVIASVGMQVFPVMLKYFSDEISFDQMIEQCGIQALAKGTLVVVCLLYPPFGISLMCYSLASMAWKEFELNQYVVLGRGKYKVIDTFFSNGTAIVDGSKQTIDYSSAVMVETSKKAFDYTGEVVYGTENSVIATSSSVSDSASEISSSVINKAVELSDGLSGIN
jgi:hypothetical protein